jgi:branched-chain amino acid aminotransferase
MGSKYICHNGKFLLSAENNLHHQNRAFCYGDALFETVHCLGTEPQFFDRHWVRLSRGMNMLKMIAGDNISSEMIRGHIVKLLNKNRIFKGARIRLAVFRDQGGYYSPERNSVSWLLESAGLEKEKYELNQKGLTADIFDGLHKPVNQLSNLKTANALPYILAGLFRIENDLDECFVLNQYGRIAECISSNVFLVYEDEVITPSLREGCISGIMREVLLDVLSSVGYKTVERGIQEKDIRTAEEIFITNAIQGIQWIGAYKNRRYFNFTARKLLSMLNEVAFPV